ncbi:unnamed protein product, partial [Symbiodinium sp. CCMP2456]
YPPFSIGMVYEHNDEELPEPDLEPNELWPDSDYGSDQEDDIFGNEDSGPPSLTDQELRDLDRKAMVTEIDRLIAMQAVQRIALSEIHKQDGTGTENTDDEGTENGHFQSGHQRLIGEDKEMQLYCGVTTLRTPSRNSILVVHVDDQAAGKSSHLEPVLNKIGRVETQDESLKANSVYPGPTHQAWKQLIHLVQYMSRNGSFDFSAIAEKQEHLLEVFSDSDWAGEAEYYAGASAASDSILLKEAVEFLTGRRCKVNLTLFLQELHKQGTLSVHPVGTKENTADIGFQDENNDPVGISEGLVSGKGSGTVQSSLGTVMFQEQFVHPQMFSYFKELGHVVQKLCASHIPEGNAEGPEEESGKESEEVREMAQAVKELKEIMANQNECMQELKQDIAGMKEPVLQQSQLTALAIKELTKEVRDLQANFKELQGRWDEFIEEEEKAREEYAKYFDEQEKLKEELRQDRDRLLEKELRMEGQLFPRTSTSPTRKEEEDISQYNDRAYFDRKQEEEEAKEAMEENEDEYYTQSYEISEEEAGEAWTEEPEATEATGPKEPKEEEEEGKPRSKETQEEYEEERKKLLAKARADIAQKEAKRKEQEKGFKPPVDKSQEYKYYTEGGHIYRQSHKTGEKIWWNYDYKYKHQKGKGKEAYEKAGKGSRPHQPFQPRDEEDKAYWASMDEEVKSNSDLGEERKWTVACLRS